MKSISYLAGPYSKGGLDVRLARFHALTHVAARLIEKRQIVYSPITMTHPIDLVLAKDGGTLGSEFWVDFDEAFMSLCNRLFVLTLPGWQDSSGVAREIGSFNARGVQPEFLSPQDYGITVDNSNFRAALSSEA